MEGAEMDQLMTYIGQFVNNPANQLLIWAMTITGFIKDFMPRLDKPYSKGPTGHTPSTSYPIFISEFGNVALEQEDIVRLYLIKEFIEKEVSIWKAFHIVSPILIDYTNIISTELSKARKDSKNNLSALAINIVRRISKHETSNKGIPSFTNMYRDLINNGYNPLIDNIKWQFEVIENNEALAELARLADYAKFREPHEWLTTVGQVIGHAVNWRHKISDDISVDPKFVKFVHIRENALSKALFFASRLIMVHYYLNLKSEYPKADSNHEGLRYQICDKVCTELSKEYGVAVSCLANDVILACLDLVRD
jgi:hypothetical protein